MTRVLVEATGAVSGGIVRVLSEVLRAWPGGDDVHVLAGTRTCEVLPSSVTAHPLPDTSRRSELSAALARARRVRRAVAPDAVVSISPSLPGALLAPDVTVLHDLFFRLWPGGVAAGSRAYRSVSYRRALAASRRIACVSARTRHDLVGWLPRLSGATAVWPLAVAEVFRRDGVALVADPALRLPARYVVVPAHNDLKGVGLAVEAFTAPDDPAVVLLAGGAERAGVLAERFRDVVPRPLVLDRLEDDALAAVVAGAAALVMPSQIEGFGLPALEALAVGTPVVVSPDPALWETGGGFPARMRTWDAPSVVAAWGESQWRPAEHWAAARRFARERSWATAAAELRALALG